MINHIQAPNRINIGTSTQLTSSTSSSIGLETAQNLANPRQLNSQISVNNNLHSNALATSLISSIQAIAEMFLGFAEHTGISITYMMNSGIEFLGAALMTVDSFFRQTGVNLNIHIDKLMAIVQGAIGTLLAAELLMKFTGSEGIIKNIKWIDKASKGSKSFAEKIATKLNMSRNGLLNVLKVGLGTTSTLVAVKKFQLTQQMIDPQQKDGFLRSMWIDILCSLETLLLFIPKGNAIEGIVEKLYLAFSSFKLLGDSAKKFVGQ